MQDRRALSAAERESRPVDSGACRSTEYVASPFYLFNLVLITVNGICFALGIITSNHKSKPEMRRSYQLIKRQSYIILSTFSVSLSFGAIFVCHAEIVTVFLGFQMPMKLYKSKS